MAILRLSLSKRNIWNIVVLIALSSISSFLNIPEAQGCISQPLKTVQLLLGSMNDLSTCDISHLKSPRPSLLGFSTGFCWDQDTGHLHNSSRPLPISAGKIPLALCYRLNLIFSRAQTTMFLHQLLGTKLWWLLERFIVKQQWQLQLQQQRQRQNISLPSLPVWYQPFKLPVFPIFPILNCSSHIGLQATTFAQHPHPPPAPVSWHSLFFLWNHQLWVGLLSEYSHFIWNASSYKIAIPVVTGTSATPCFPLFDISLFIMASMYMSIKESRQKSKMRNL